MKIKNLNTPNVMGTPETEKERIEIATEWWYFLLYAASIRTSNDISPEAKKRSADLLNPMQDWLHQKAMLTLGPHYRKMIRETIMERFNESVYDQFKDQL